MDGDSRLVGETIQTFVDENKEIASEGMLLDELRKELGRRGSRYLGRQPVDYLAALYEEYKDKRQRAIANSPVDSHLESEIASSSCDEPMRLRGGTPLVVTDRSQQRHASFNSQTQRAAFPDGIFNIKLMSEHVHHPRREIIRSARRDPDARQSLIDPRTAAEFIGCAEADVRIGGQIRLRWCGYKDGSETCPPRNTECRIEEIQDANVVFGRDIGEQNGKKDKRRSSGDEEDDGDYMETLVRMTRVAAKQEAADRKRQATNRDDSQRKRAKNCD